MFGAWGRGAGAYLERRATSSLRCAWRVSSTRSRMLRLRSSFGADMAAAGSRARALLACGRECAAAVTVKVVVVVVTGEGGRRGQSRRCPTLYDARGVEPRGGLLRSADA
jgi:hypothetical protein